MKALILAAGYGTRLERDLRNDTSGAYACLVGVPKPLLPVGQYPLITHWIKQLEHLEQIEDVFVVTNGTNHAQFEAWASDWKKVKLISDQSTSNEDRLGAVGCMSLAIRHFNVEDNLVVIAGDTLFYEDFNLINVLETFESNRRKTPDSSLLLYVTCTDADVHKYGILETDEEEKVVDFLEKPQPSDTASRKECPCFYVLSKASLKLIHQFLKDKEHEDIKSRDAPGNFISYLVPRLPVYATEVSGRFDVGGLQSYITCHKHFSDNLRSKRN